MKRTVKIKAGLSGFLMLCKNISLQK